MMRPLLVCALVCLTAGAASADPKVDSAIDVFNGVAGDPGRLQIYCQLSDAVEAQGDAEDAASEAKVDGYLEQLGGDFEAAWDTADEVDENSADGKRLEAALNALDEKCPD